MTSAVTEPRPSSARMVRDTLYHGEDIAAVFDDVVQQQWLARQAKLPKHQIIDALLLLAVEHADELPAYLEKLAERRSTGEGDNQ